MKKNTENSEKKLGFFEILTFGLLLGYLIYRYILKQKDFMFDNQDENQGIDKDFILNYEKLRLKAYNDGFGYMTTGIGHLIKESESFLLNKILTESEAWQIFYLDVKPLLNAVNKNFPHYTTNQKTALVSLGFQAGIGSLNKIIERIKNKTLTREIYSSYSKVKDKETGVYITHPATFDRRLDEWDLLSSSKIFL